MEGLPVDDPLFRMMLDYEEKNQRQLDALSRDTYNFKAKRAANKPPETRALERYRSALNNRQMWDKAIELARPKLATYGGHPFELVSRFYHQLSRRR